MLRNLFTLPTRRRAVGELVFAGSLWGFGFVASRWALTGVGPFWTTALRFAIAFGLAVPLLLANRALRAQAGRDQLQLTAAPGLLLGATLILQIYGLQYTTVTRAAFITTLYIIFVPLLERPFFGRKIPWLHIVWVVLALVGAGLICQVESGDWNRGDWIVLGCAITSAVHILWLEAVAPRMTSSFVFNSYQSLWAGALAIACAVIGEGLPVGPVPERAWLGLFILGFGVQFIAFLIQVRTQRVLSPSVVSMLFLLESPFASLWAYFAFGETLTVWQWLGAVLILAPAAGTIRPQSDVVPPPLDS